MEALRKFADNTDTHSAAHQYRQRRFQHFRQLIDTLPKPVHILDIGGTEQFWQMMGCTDPAEVNVTLVNVVPVATSLPNFSALIHDACDLGCFQDDQFPVVFSNSVIEHVPTWEGQQQMAAEIRRVGKRYFVQTPNRFFPIEPHFLFPFFQFLPLRAKLFLLQRFPLGWADKAESNEQAILQAASIRLLTHREFASLFPDARIVPERVAGLTKSFIAIS